MADVIKVLLADDHILVRQGLRKLLEGQKNLRIVGEAGDGTEAIRLAEKLSPDVALLDIMMPGISGLEAARQLQGRTHVVILTMHSNEAYLLEALRFGVLGYVLKDAQPAELVAAIESASLGKHYLGSPFSRFTLEHYLSMINSTPADAYDSLTRREREVLKLAAEGRTAVEIARLLDISPRTAEIHRANLLRKLNLRSQSELVLFAVRRGILSLEQS